MTSRFKAAEIALAWVAVPLVGSVLYFSQQHFAQLSPRHDPSGFLSSAATYGFPLQVVLWGALVGAGLLALSHHLGGGLRKLLGWLGSVAYVLAAVLAAILINLAQGLEDQAHCHSDELVQQFVLLVISGLALLGSWWVAQRCN